jgi:integrase
MAYQDLPAFLERLRALHGVSARCLEFQILTVARPAEALEAAWAELDLDQRVWIVPAARMKAGREHRVPLSNRAMEILEGMRGQSDFYLFPGTKRGRPRSGMELARAIKKAGGGPVTAHGFRSSFRDWAGDATHYPREIAEAALAHSVGNATEAAYRRGSALEKRREMMQAWSDFLCQPVGAKVVRLWALK